MSSKKTHSRSAIRRARKTRRSLGKYIGFIVLGLLLLAVAWMVFSSGARQAAEQDPTPVQVAEDGPMPVLVATKQYDSAPPMLIDVDKDYFATVRMATGGEFVIQLFPDKAPITVNSFVFLARQGYFDGVTFHRVLEGFMAQGGDPTGTGRGGPGYQFVNEYSDLTFDKAGVVAMANAGLDTNGSQFFITFAPQPQLNGGYTIFGQVISGMDVVNAITRRDPNENPTYPGDAIETIIIDEE
jgi:cyclophilin family peptidyl-prolyl cis-trans isomerase